VILVDTSVWVEHLRAADKVLAHPFVIGELALGNLRQREMVLQALAGAELWTNDKKLDGVAVQLGVAITPARSGGS
jgi:predicted nucleic acid-binding protein